MTAMERPKKKQASSFFIEESDKKEEGRRCKRNCIILVIFVALFGGGLGAYFGTRGSSSDSNPEPTAEESPFRTYWKIASMSNLPVRQKNPLSERTGRLLIEALESFCLFWHGTIATPVLNCLMPNTRQIMRTSS